MKTMRKKIAALIAVACLALCGLLLAACGESSYTVKVVLPDGLDTPVEGVELTFCDAEDESNVVGTVKTGANGKATGSFKEGNYLVTVTGGLPEGYGVSEERIYTKDWGSNSYLLVLSQTVRTYTVSVLLPSGRGQSGVGVTFTPDDEAEETIRKVTDANGMISVSLSTKTSYLVTLDESTLPENFLLSESDKNGFSTANGTSIRFQLVAPVSYSMEVTGPAEADLSGIRVSYSVSADGSGQKPLGTTDGNGKLTVKMAPTEGYVFITPPEGYVYNGYLTSSTYKLSDKTTTTFKLIPYAALTLETPMTDDEVSAFQTQTGNSLFEETMESGLCKAYSTVKTSRAGEQQVYSFKAKESGTYWFFANAAGEKYSMSASGNLNLGNSLNAINQDTPFKHFSIICEEGATYYLSVEAEADFQFALVTPKQRNETIVTTTGDVSLTIYENLPAEIVFVPGVAGDYTFTATAGSGIKIEEIANYFVVDTSENGTITVEVSIGNIFYEDGTPSNNTWRLRYTALGNAAYPVTVNVHITRKEHVEDHTETTIAEVKETLKQFANQTGELVAIGVNGTNGQIVKGSDGYYHFGSETGAVVVIKLQGAINAFYPEADFALLDENDISYYRFFVSSEDHVYHFVDYAKFLRGYTAYGDEASASGEYYLKYVNDDGVYPLTDELITFLKYVARDNAAFFSFCVNEFTADSLWLFSAFYYE